MKKYVVKTQRFWCDTDAPISEVRTYYSTNNLDLAVRHYNYLASLTKQRALSYRENKDKSPVKDLRDSIYYKVWIEQNSPILLISNVGDKNTNINVSDIPEDKLNIKSAEEIISDEFKY